MVAELQHNERIPKILAPAGGSQQFLAALYSGADSVYLGLNAFNARARAQNFSLDSLAQHVPLAHKYGMKVLVALNILLKQAELNEIVDHLTDLEALGVDAVIVQDLGLAHLVKTCFPGLRLHASTQLAIHNIHGVRAAARLGFQRVVLARELTLLEIKKICLQIQDLGVEIEVFCHGSLCYSYSGLCFFSGSESSRSGNRGECAYTCRKPYKILNEPGEGFLFSMKDLNTLEHLPSLVSAGVHTLKIEGRKKDAQYVASAVQAYRKALDRAVGHSTLRENAPDLARQVLAEKSGAKETLLEALTLSYRRRETSLFLKGRYHENVIDLQNASHQGVQVGEVTAGAAGI